QDRHRVAGPGHGRLLLVAAALRGARQDHPGGAVAALLHAGVLGDGYGPAGRNRQRRPAAAGGRRAPELATDKPGDSAPFRGAVRDRPAAFLRGGARSIHHTMTLSLLARSALALLVSVAIAGLTLTHAAVPPASALRAELSNGGDSGPVVPPPPPEPELHAWRFRPKGPQQTTPITRPQPGV